MGKQYEYASPYFLYYARIRWYMTRMYVHVHVHALVQLTTIALVRSRMRFQQEQHYQLTMAR